MMVSVYAANVLFPGTLTASSSGSLQNHRNNSHCANRTLISR